MRTLKPLYSLVLTLGLAGCVTARGAVAGPEAIARLERQQQTTPTSAAVNRALGIAYYQTARYPDARAALETAARLDPKDGTTALYLGLTAEAQNDYPAAKAAYSSYLQYGRTSRVRGQLQSRLAALARKELAAEAKQAVAQEATLSGVVGSPRTVAVMPMKFTGSDTTLQPLERGMADLLTTDLARSSQLTLVERSRIQALLDEMALQKRTATDAGTSARAGRLVRAGRVVQGALLQLGTPGTENPQLRVDAAVVDVPTSQVSGAAQGSNQLDQLFSLEKQIALDLFREMGVTLTVAERNSIEERPTRSLAAFLAYSRGLAAEDAGNFDAALRYYNDAVRIDPGFGAAQQKGEQAKAVSAGSAVTAQTVETSLKGSSEEKVVTAAAAGNSTNGSGAGGGASLASTAQNVANGVNTSTTGALTAPGTGATPSVPPPPTSTTSNPPPAQTPALGTVSFSIPVKP
ncbi:MAG: hypothetical protein JWN53_954 [Gemmatimonadetes bacterium]|nr:hypothetical protein [Gemmatimonadota bacterium]